MRHLTSRFQNCLDFLTDRGDNYPDRLVLWVGLLCFALNWKWGWISGERYRVLIERI